MKGRIRIPQHIHTKVMYVSHNTCCVCAEMGVGKRVQIHHIDGDRSNNAFENLAVLCLECHDKTQWKGGFAQQLTPALVTEYNNNWRDRVCKRRNTHDERVANLSRQSEFSNSNLLGHRDLRIPLVAFINSLPELKATLLDQAQPEWDTGTTATMVQASYDYIDSFVAIMVTLSSYYSTDLFGNQSPEEYFSEIVSSRRQWHRAIAEPEGPGTRGTMVSLDVASSVQTEVEIMVEDMVKALVPYDNSFDFPSWSKRWRSH